MEQDTPIQGKIQYVEELRSREEYPPGDAWISITDAARVTRTSEAMARRWVSSGRIPAKKEPVGINARTRLVRLSDVAQIRPIIDPTAAITDEVHKLDLPSIPRQMQEIMADHEHLHQEMTTLQQTIEQQATEIKNRMQQGLEELEQRMTAQLAELHTQFGAQRMALEQLVNALDTERQQREAALKDVLAHLADQDQVQSRRLDEVTQRLTSELEAIRTDHQKVATRLGQLFTVYEEHRQIVTRHADQIQQAESRIAGLPAQIELVRTALTAQLEQQSKDIYTEIHQVAQDEAHDAADFTKWHEQLKRQVENVATKNEAATITAMSAQRRIDEAAEKMNALQKQLNEERSAREILTQQVQVLLQHVNTPHSHTESTRTPPRKRKQQTEG